MVSKTLKTCFSFVVLMLTCGIDEAGRGPLIGPMVVAGVLAGYESADKFKSLGVRDSKLLSHKKRLLLYEKIVSVAENYKVLVLSPETIDESLNSSELNLNWLEARESAKIINFLKPDRIVVDSPSNNVRGYSKYLLELVNDKKIRAVVEHKADLNHVECAAASILAKVTREWEIEKIKKMVGDFGSGYMSDPKTVKFLEENYDKHPDVFRKTWAPYRRVSGLDF